MSDTGIIHGRLVRLAKSHFDSGENFVASVMGTYDIKLIGLITYRYGVFIATDKRLIFYGKKPFGFELEVCPYEKINSIEIVKGLTGYKITVHVSGRKINIKRINTDDIDGFINYVSNQAGKKELQLIPAIKN
jgi:hypothetical protein